MTQQIRIDQFFDSAGRVTQFPSKQKQRQAVLAYLAEKFQPGSIYSEGQVNAICSQWHTFGDFFLLRRELVDNGFLARERDGSRYWRVSDLAKAGKADAGGIRGDQAPHGGGGKGD